MSARVPSKSVRTAARSGWSRNGARSAGSGAGVVIGGGAGAVAPPQDVERIEGQPAAAFGETGLAEVFTPAASAPPDRPLRPGDRWTINHVVRVADTGSTRLTGEGRLLALGVVHGRKTASVHS